MLENSTDAEGTLHYLPQDVRLTLINSKGEIMYDNVAETLKRTIWDDLKSILQTTQTRDMLFGNQYYKSRLPLLCQKSKNGSFLRLALPYVITWTNFIHFDNILLYIVVFLFL